MLRRSVSFLVIVFTLFTVTGCVDQSGGDEKESKLVLTSVATTEIFDKLEVPAGQVVGVPDTKAYSIPKRYKDVERVGMAMSPDMEKILTLKPDLVIGPNSLEGELSKKYEKLGLDSAFINLSSVSGMFKSIDDLGDLLGREEEAKVLVDEYEAYRKKLENKYEGKKKPKVLILMGLPGGSYVIATESSYVGDLVKLTGAKNVYGDGDGQDFLNVSVEDIVGKEPDYILRASHAMPDQVKKFFDKEFSEKEVWKNFKATKENRVFDLDNSYFGMSATFRYKKALEILDGIFDDFN